MLMRSSPGQARNAKTLPRGAFGSILRWYKKRWQEYGYQPALIVESAEFPIIKVLVSAGTRLPGIGPANEDSIIADPDDDGNYSLNYDGRRYMVTGQISA